MMLANSNRFTGRTGGVLTVITLGLFNAIGMNVMQFYTDFIAIPGGVAAPVVAFFLIRTYPAITSKIAPVIARVFTPVVLVTLVFYLVSLVFTNISISSNRNLLIVFNVMLLGVLALIIFSVSGIGEEKSGNKNRLMLILLSGVAIITNLLVFVNLIIIAVKLYRSGFRGAPTETIEKSVAGYLTVYAAWTVIAIFIVPLAFGFR